MRLSVVTVSDSTAAGKRQDLSGPAIVELIQKSARLHGEKVISTTTVPDDQAQIERVLLEHSADSDVIITTGGTGFAESDVTPEATLRVVDRRCTGLEVALHNRSLAATPMAALSRAVAGIRGNTLIVNFPGSVKAVKEYWEVVEPVLHHAVDLLTDRDNGKLHQAMAQEANEAIQKELTDSGFMLTQFRFPNLLDSTGLNGLSSGMDPCRVSCLCLSGYFFWIMRHTLIILHTRR